MSAAQPLPTKRMSRNGRNRRDARGLADMSNTGAGMLLSKLSIISPWLNFDQCPEGVRKGVLISCFFDETKHFQVINDRGSCNKPLIGVPVGPIDDPAVNPGLVVAC